MSFYNEYYAGPVMIMLIGVPGSGKSTWIKNTINMEDATNLIVLSTDNYISGIADFQNTTYNEIFASEIKNAERRLTINLEKAVKDNTSIIWDQTNLTITSRAKKLSRIPDQYQKIAIYFPTPHLGLHEKNLNCPSRHGKVIPPNILMSMKGILEVPRLEEGFDIIQVYKRKL